MKAVKATKERQAKKPAAGCDCAEQVNKQLKDRGQCLENSMMFSMSTGRISLAHPLISIRWINKPVRRKSLPIVTCAYCPFCGKKSGAK